MYVTACQAAKIKGAPNKAYLYRLINNGAKEDFFREIEGKTYINTESFSWKNYIYSRTHTAIVNNMTYGAHDIKSRKYKKCSRCGFVMPIDWFSFNYKSIDKHSCACKTCLSENIVNYNVCRPYVSRKGYTKEELVGVQKEYEHRYYITHKAERAKRDKERYNNNRDKMLEYGKKYRAEHKPEPKIIIKKTKEELAITKKLYHEKHKEKYRELGRKYYHKTAEKINKQRQEDRDNLTDAYCRGLLRNKYEIDRELIPDEMVEAYRAYVLAKRAIKQEKQNGENHE